MHRSFRDKKKSGPVIFLFLMVAVIGMVTPNIIYWDAQSLKNCKVTDPLKETRQILDRIEGQYDLLVGVYHMGINNEFGTKNSGVTDICNACPA